VKHEKNNVAVVLFKSSMSFEAAGCDEFEHARITIRRELDVIIIVKLWNVSGV
jgi:hypothetical protein